MPSNFAFKFNLRRYSTVNPIPFTFTWDETVAGFEAHAGGWVSRVTVTGGDLTVGRCWLTVSKPVLQAPMVSALAATI